MERNERMSRIGSAKSSSARYRMSCRKTSMDSMNSLSILQEEKVVSDLDITDTDKYGVFDASGSDFDHCSNLSRENRVKMDSVFKNEIGNFEIQSKYEDVEINDAMKTFDDNMESKRILEPFSTKCDESGYFTCRTENGESKSADEQNQDLNVTTNQPYLGKHTEETGPDSVRNDACTLPSFNNEDKEDSTITSMCDGSAYSASRSERAENDISEDERIHSKNYDNHKQVIENQDFDCKTFHTKFSTYNDAKRRSKYKQTEKEIACGISDDVLLRINDPIDGYKLNEKDIHLTNMTNEQLLSPNPSECKVKNNDVIVNHNELVNLSPVNNNTKTNPLIQQSQINLTNNGASENELDNILRDSDFICVEKLRELDEHVNLFQSNFNAGNVNLGDSTKHTDCKFIKLPSLKCEGQRATQDIQVCDKAIQATEQFPLNLTKLNIQNSSLVRGSKRIKKLTPFEKEELQERFQKQSCVNRLKSKKGINVQEIVNDDGSLKSNPLDKTLKKRRKTTSSRKARQASPATAMEIQQLMTLTINEPLLKENAKSFNQYDGDSEDEAKEDIDIGHYSYIHACKQLENPPIRKIFDQLQTNEIRLQFVGLNTNDVIALAYGLLHNNRVESVDLEDNRMDEDGMLHIIELLNYNNVISSISLSNNRLSVNCAGMLKEALSSSTWLTHLNLSGTKFGDDGAKHISLAIRSNISIKWMNLSNNDIGVTGAQHIGRALSINDTLEVLDLSWNHIRRMGALAICKGLQENSSIVNFNLSWNGFALEGSLALENVFKENMSLKCIDLSSNRINWDGLVYLTRGIRKNNVLRILKLGDNPLPVDGILKLLHAVASRKSNLAHLSLENIPVNIKIMDAVNHIASQRLFTITHGGVLDSTDMFGIKRGRERREDPFTLLIRFIGMMGIRVLDLFRIFESGANSGVTKENFIRGVKKVGAPLSDREIELVARRLVRKGAISYSILANGVRNHVREEKKEDKRQEHIEVKKQEHRKNFLKSNLGEVKAPEVKELTMFKTAAGKNFARIMSSSNMLSSRKESPSPESSRVSLLPKLVHKNSVVSERSIRSLETYRIESARRRRKQRLFSII